LKNVYHRLKNYILHAINAKDEHSIHSPFVFEFYTEVIRRNNPYYIFESIEALRYELAGESKKINISDYGTGALKSRNQEKTIRSIVLQSEKNAKTGALLFRMVHYLKPRYIIDLGTSLGLTTAYIAAAHTAARIYTFEGCSQTLQVAKENFEKLRLHNIVPVQGNIDDTLANVLANVPSVDFVFFDANHRYEPTLNYFKQCLQKTHEDSVLVFDDIYWSGEMTEAWKEIKNHSKVTLTIDLYELGIIFFRNKQPKQHFKLRW
jgi:predicted O-methyltransferase YrrM